MINIKAERKRAEEFRKIEDQETSDSNSFGNSRSNSHTSLHEQNYFPSSTRTPPSELKRIDSAIECREIPTEAFVMSVELNSKQHRIYSIQISRHNNAMVIYRTGQDFWNLHTLLLKSYDSRTRTLPFLEQEREMNDQKSMIRKQILNYYLQQIIKYDQDTDIVTKFFFRKNGDYVLSQEDSANFMSMNNILKKRLIRKEFSVKIAHNGSVEDMKLVANVDVANLLIKVGDLLGFGLMVLFYKDEFGTSVSVDSDQDLLSYLNGCERAVFYTASK